MAILLQVIFIGKVSKQGDLILYESKLDRIQNYNPGVHVERKPGITEQMIARL